MVTSRNRLRLRGQSLELRCPSPFGRWVLERYHLDHLIQREPVHPSLAAAALARWVDVLSTERYAGIEDAAVPVTAVRTTPQPDRVIGGPHRRLKTSCRSSSPPVSSRSNGCAPCASRPSVELDGDDHAFQSVARDRCSTPSESSSLAIRVEEGGAVNGGLILAYLLRSSTCARV